MAKEYFSLNEVCKELQMQEAQVRALVSVGQLQCVQMGGEMRFVRSAVEEFKQKAERRETVSMGEGKESAGGAFVEEEATDIAEGPGEKSANLDLGDIDAEAVGDEGDQTSVLRPAAKGAAPQHGGEEPIFQFEEEAAPKEATKPGALGKMPGAAPDGGELVADLLKEGPGAEEDESLETVDLAELEGGEPEEAAVGVAAAAGEADTIGLEEADVETTEVGAKLLGVSEERIEEEEGKAAAVKLAPLPSALGVNDLVSVRPSVMSNVFLGVSIFMVALGGFMIVSTALGLDQNPVSRLFYNLLKSVV